MDACTTESNVVTVTVSAGPPPPATLTSNQPANTGCDGDRLYSLLQVPRVVVFDSLSIMLVKEHLVQSIQFLYH